MTQPPGTQYVTELQIGERNNNITVRMKWLGNGHAQIYVGLYCDASGDIEIQATEHVSFCSKSLSFSFDSISDKIDRATGGFARG